jgi:hypothetical protein
MQRFLDYFTANSLQIRRFWRLSTVDTLPIPRRALKLIAPLQYSSERPLIVNAEIVSIGASAEVHGRLVVQQTTP